MALPRLIKDSPFLKTAWSVRFVILKTQDWSANLAARLVRHCFNAMTAKSLSTISNAINQQMLFLFPVNLKMK
jgi:hypothetical protein